MLDVSWVDEQIERLRHSTATMQTARDYAALCICRNHLADKESRQKADFDTAPTLEQVEAALDTITVTTAEERDRKRDAKTWMQMLKNEE